MVDFIIKFYGLLIYRTRLLSPLRFIIRKVADFTIPFLLSRDCSGKTEKSNKVITPEKRIVVSLTSFPARINTVWVVIKCLKRQSVKPDKIVLWLSKEQFNKVKLPDSLTSLVDDTFEIRMVDNDYRSHKKYCYAFKEFKDDYVVLVDDDIYYSSTMIYNLLMGLKAHPGFVICQYGSLIRYNSDGTIPPFETWWDERKEAVLSNDFFLGTGGGSLFEPNRLIDTVLDTELAISLTPLADDIWINAMVRLSWLSIYKIKNGLLLQMSEAQTFALKKNNAYGGQNDEQFRKVISYFIKNKGVNPFCKKN